jgi:hypothetical protein
MFCKIPYCLPPFSQGFSMWLCACLAQLSGDTLLFISLKRKWQLNIFLCLLPQYVVKIIEKNHSQINYKKDILKINANVLPGF